MIALDWFPPDYVTARERFRRAAKRLGWSVESHPVAARGPGNEELTIDVAISSAEESDRALVTSSGIHGVEGHFGSAVQVGLLERWARLGGGPRLRCVFVHGLNPYGFAWQRRGNEHNVDLNRNFLGDGETYAGSPRDYAKLDRLLNPCCPPSRLEPFPLKALLAIARRGMPAMKQAVAGGQYDFPRGLFYGGARPAETTLLLAKRWQKWLGDSEQVVHLDFHTGLGTWAGCKLLIDQPLTPPQRAWWSEWFGPRAYEACNVNGIAYAARGSFGQWCVQRQPRRQYLFACAEFGTYPPLRVLAGLRAENQAHHWCGPDHPRTQHARQWLRELFCPVAAGWRQRVLTQSFALVDRAVRGLGVEEGALQR